MARDAREGDPGGETDLELFTWVPFPSRCRWHRSAGNDNLVSKPRRRQFHVRGRPDLGELGADRLGFVVLALRIERLGEAEQRPAVDAIVLQAVAIDGLGVR